MRNEVQAARTEPGAFDLDVRHIVGDELTDLRMPVHAGNKFQIDLRLRQRGGGALAVAGHGFVLVAHGAHGDELARVGQRARECVLDDL